MCGLFVVWWWVVLGLVGVLEGVLGLFVVFV